MASVYSLNGSGEWSGKGSFLEVRIGKFPVGKASDRVVREIVVGAAFGDIKNWLGGERLDACFLKPFIQPSPLASHRDFLTRHLLRGWPWSLTCRRVRLCIPRTGGSLRIFLTRKKTHLF